MSNRNECALSPLKNAPAAETGLHDEIDIYEGIDLTQFKKQSFLKQGFAEKQGDNSEKIPEESISENTREILWLCSRLFCYPDTPRSFDIDWQKISHEKFRSLFYPFLTWVESTNFLSVQEHYVKTFDFNPETTPYLTFYTCELGSENKRSDGRGNRGEALVRLKKIYRESGLTVSSHELPDYLPLVLEFLSVAPSRSFYSILEELAPALQRLENALSREANPYAYLLQACLLALQSCY